GRTDAGVDPAGGRADPGPAAGGRAEHRFGDRTGGRRAAGDQSAHRQDRLHRLDRRWTEDHGVRHQEHHSGDAGAGRQVAQHLLQGRDGSRRR
ncbi:hypothetical protein LTR94_036831, partial [Friedmanniomyces endolithicus]